MATFVFALTIAGSSGQPDRTAAGNGVAHRSVRGTPASESRFAVSPELGRRSVARTLGVAPKSGGEADSGDVARSVTLAERGADSSAAVAKPGVSGSAVELASEPERAAPDTKIVSLHHATAGTCRSARKAVAWYRAKQRAWSQLHPHASWPKGRKPRSCADARYLARVAKIRAHISRVTYERYVDAHTLHDPEVRPGNRAWHRAVQEAQRAYPGTRGWLLSCSASEGGWGRWVPNSDGAPPGGWMQFYESTFWRMWATARVDVTRRGFRVPRSAHSWYSPLGQALAGAWGLVNGRRGEWHGAGC